MKKLMAKFDFFISSLKMTAKCIPRPKVQQMMPLSISVGDNRDETAFIPGAHLGSYNLCTTSGKFLLEHITSSAKYYFTLLVLNQLFLCS